MRAAHSEAWGHPVVFGNHLFQRPLNIGEAASHLPNNCKVASGAAHWLGPSRNMEYRVRGDKLFSEFLAASVDEFHETAHYGFVGFCCHGDLYYLCVTVAEGSGIPQRVDLSESISPASPLVA